MKTWILVAVVLLVSPILSGCSNGQARGILSNMADAYAKLESYQDHGTVEMKTHAESEQPVHVQFSTLFQQPDSFKFEWTSEADDSWDMVLTKQGAVVSHEGEITSFRFPGPETHGTPLKAFLRTTIFDTQGGGYTVPSMLVDEVPDYCEELCFARLVGEDAIGDTDCYLIKAKDDAIDVTLERTLWIGKEDYLLRKMESRYVGLPEGYDVESAEMLKTAYMVETHKGIRINQEIPESAFVFTPPEDVLDKPAENPE